MSIDINCRSEIDISKYVIITKIKDGGFGHVFLVKDKETNKQYAAKILRITKEEEDDNIIDREVDIMFFINHPTFIKFIGYSRKDFENNDAIVILMEYATKGSLAEVLLQNIKLKNFTQTLRQKCILGITRGMKYLHNHNIIHRDLKLENVLIDDNYNPRTLIYQAPEIIIGDPYDEKVDVYAFAILIYQIIADSYPYPDYINHKLNEFKLSKKIVENNYRPNLKKIHNKKLRKLISKCWAPVPSDRPSFDEIYDIFSNCDIKNKYLLEDVDLDELREYVEFINKVDEHLERQLDRIIAIKYENEKLKLDNDLKEKNDQLKEELKKVTDEKKDIENKCIRLKDENYELRIENSSSMDSIEELKSKLQSKNAILKKQNDQLKNEIKELNDTVEQQREEIEELNDKVEQQKEEIEELNDTVEQQREEIKELKDTVEQQKKEISNKKNMIIRIEDENNEIKIENDRLIDEKEELKSKLQSKNEQLKKQNNQLNNDNKSLNNTIEQQKDTIAKKNNEILRLNTYIDELSIKYDQLKDNLNTDDE